MNKIFFQIYRALVPKPVRTRILLRSLGKRIPRYFAGFPPREINSELEEVLKYLESNPVSIFPYPFQHNYSPRNVEVFTDKSLGMRYVIQDGKRLYFRRRWSEERIRRAYSDLMCEQDPASPHRYLSGSFDVSSDDVIADIGAAEGNFSLAVVDRVKRIYLFERDREWAEALRATFGPWKDKVVIINKYLSSHDDDRHARFDTFIGSNGDVTFLKIDVDGAESAVLSGCEGLFRSQRPIRIALCTYHRNEDESEFTALLSGYGFNVSPSRGYMINYYDKKLKAPYLRRGLIRAVR
ncbi:MAG: hypothetical protein MUD02_02565 [Bacteroidales bacterium]|jgi:hypothetical protein|nr:hypothetical protein [Bacteroidales bacterium]MCU0407809.1 hypothetical protein [Bacteroidales bacterium]